MTPKDPLNGRQPIIIYSPYAEVYRLCEPYCWSAIPSLRFPSTRILIHLQIGNLRLRGGEPEPIRTWRSKRASVFPRLWENGGPADARVWGSWTSDKTHLGTIIRDAATNEMSPYTCPVPTEQHATACTAGSRRNVERSGMLESGDFASVLCNGLQLRILEKRYCIHYSWKIVNII